MASWTIKGIRTVESQPQTVDVALVKELEYHGEWMGEEYVTVTVKSAVPVEFRYGDYLTYRGEDFLIDYDPNVIKRARANTYGEGFVYDNIKLYSLARELNGVAFKDYVLNWDSPSNENSYSSQDKFSFFAGSVEDLADRIQANLDRAKGSGTWKIYTPNSDRVRQRFGSLPSDWQSIYGSSSNAGKTDISINADAIYCSDALQLCYDQFAVGFTTKDRNIYIAAPAVRVSKNFMYGKDNGLSEIECTNDDNEKIVTRLSAYGSSNNLPLNFYANLGKKVVVSIAHKSTREYIVDTPTYILWVDKAWDSKLKNAFWGEKYAVTITYMGMSAKFMVGHDTFNYGDEKYKSGLDHTTDYMFLYVISPVEGYALGIFNNIEAGDTVEMTGVNINEMPSEFVVTPQSYNYPALLSINNVMLPGFPDKSLDEWVQDRISDPNISEDERAYWEAAYERYVFSTSVYSPWIQSPNSDLYGIREGVVYFDGSGENEEILPTIEGTGADIVETGSNITDNGYLEDGKDITFNIVVNGGLDWEEALNTAPDANSVTISMKTGFCVGREFNVKAAKKVTEGYELTLERQKDGDRYFPYYESADGYCQINGGNNVDSFVALGIQLPQSYVDAASIKLLKAALKAIDEIDHPSTTYIPKIDEIYMARNYDAVVNDDPEGIIKYGSVNLHDTFRAGMQMEITDADDLNIHVISYIDNLTIKENGNNGIPTYDVVLRNKKDESIFRSLEKKIVDVANGGVSIKGGNGGSESRGSVDPTKNYLSKKYDDTANGVIGFLKGLWVGARQWYWDKTGNIRANKINAEGEVTVKQIQSPNYNRDNSMNGTGFVLTNWKDGKSFLAVDELMVRGKMTVSSLEIREETYTGGNQHWSPAGSVIFRVDYIGHDENDQEVILGFQEVTPPYTVNGVPFFTIGSGNTGYLSYASRNEIRKKIGSQISEVDFFRCYIVSDNGTTATRNFWCVDDLARCQTYNIVKRDLRDGEQSVGAIQSEDPLVGVEGAQQITTTMENVYFWRMVIGVGSKRLEDNKTYNYIDLANKNITIEGEGGSESIVVTTFDVGSDIPAAGDTMICFGNATNVDRMGIISAETYNGNGITGETPSIKMYSGVNTFSLEGRRTALISPRKVEFLTNIFRLVNHDGSVVPVQNPRGAWSASEKYHYADVVTHNGSTWMCKADPVYYWVNGDNWEYNQNLHYDENDPRTHLYKDGVLDENADGFEGSNGHPIGDPETLWKLVYTFVKGGGSFEPTMQNQLVWKWLGEAAQGPKGDFKSRVFARTNRNIGSEYFRPQGGHYDTPWPGDEDPYTYQGVEWHDGIPSGEAQLWSSVCTFFGEGGSSGWSIPAPETDTADIDIEYAFAQANDAQPPVPDANNRHKDNSPYQGQVWFDPALDLVLPQGKTWADIVWRAECKIKNGEYVKDGLGNIAWSINKIKGEDGKVDTQEIIDVIEEVIDIEDIKEFTVIVSPQVIFVNQTGALDNTGVEQFTPGYTTIRFLKSGVAQEINLKTLSAWGTSDDGNDVRMTNGSSISPASTKTDKVVGLAAISKAQDASDGKWKYQYDHGYLLVTVTAGGEYVNDIYVGGKDYTFKVAWFLNRLGTRTTEIVGDLERTIMERTDYMISEKADNLLLNTDEPNRHLGNGTNGTWANTSLAVMGDGTCSIGTNITDSPVSGYTQSFIITGNTIGNKGWIQKHTFWRSSDSYMFNCYARATAGTTATAFILVWQDNKGDAFLERITVGSNWTRISLIISILGFDDEAVIDYPSLYSGFMFLGTEGVGSIEYIAPSLVLMHNGNVVKADYVGRIETSASGVTENFQRTLSDALGGDITEENMGDYARTATENYSKLTSGIFVNMLSCSEGDGWLKYNGNDINLDEQIQSVSGGNDYVSTAVSLKKNVTYVFSVYATTQPNIYVGDCDGDPTKTGEDIEDDNGWSHITPVSTASGDTYKGASRYYVTFTPSKAGYYKIELFNQSQFTFYRAQLEAGRTPTTWTPGTKNYGSEIRQTATEVEISVKDDLSSAGIYVDSKSIEMQANKFTLKNSSNQQIVGVDSYGNFGITGVLRTKLFYADTLEVTQNYNVDLNNNPYYTYVSRPTATSPIILTLPDPANYEGVELRFFSPIIGSSGNVIQISCSNKIRTLNRSNTISTVSTLALNPFKLGTVKAITINSESYWWTIDEGWQAPNS